MSVEEASFLAWVKHYRPDENSVNSTDLVLPQGRARRARARPRAAARRLARSTRSCGRCTRGHEGRGVPEDGVEEAAAELLGRRRRAAVLRSPRARHRAARPRSRARGPQAPAPAGAGVRRQGRDAREERRRSGPRRAGSASSSRPGRSSRSRRCGRGAPPHRAGLYAEDELVAEGGFRVDRAGLWDRLCERGPAGTLRLTVFRRDELVEVDGAARALARRHRLARAASRTRAAEQRAAFEAWSGTSWPGR